MELGVALLEEIKVQGGEGESMYDLYKRTTQKIKDIMMMVL